MLSPKCIDRSDPEFDSANYIGMKRLDRSCIDGSAPESDIANYIGTKTPRQAMQHYLVA